VFWILFIGIGPIGLAYHWWELGIKRGNVHLIAVLSYFIPVGSALLIGLLFREALNPALVPGALLITVGAWLGKRAARE
jgi:drug/metabolite transporter (DMT)-like permease